MIERGDQVCWDTILERKRPGLMPLSGVAPLYNSVIAGLYGRQLARVVLELLGLDHGFLSLFRLERQLGQANGGGSWSAGSLVQRGPGFNVVLGIAW